ncbi:hypothetical protein EGT74_00025 [Chitinophaga lutea]|uniref:Uncharacterized protein n=1 Tax=Chitinophaga lutea TaxID=2488634 RepID=A0A3N4PTM1_9BACT|nr:hypothetical protein [Chitinophaga lutea]RPE11982.1 hypothetical protein EGT74_00025 [Chitinophaga lutea]
MASFNFSPVLLALLLSGITYVLVYLFFIRTKNFNKKEIPVPIVQAAGVRESVSPSFSHRLPTYERREPEIYLTEDDDIGELELVEDDSSILLKEAESVIDQISAVIDNIASQPANPAEVFTKIRAIVSQYSIFQGTEFYDAINRYVAVSVERELALRFTEAELSEMWA